MFLDVVIIAVSVGTADARVEWSLVVGTVAAIDMVVETQNNQRANTIFSIAGKPVVFYGAGYL